MRENFGVDSLNDINRIAINFRTDYCYQCDKNQLQDQMLRLNVKAKQLTPSLWGCHQLITEINLKIKCKKLETNTVNSIAIS